MRKNKQRDQEFARRTEAAIKRYEQDEFKEFEFDKILRLFKMR
ncbi:MAG TPA: hypothetical protein VJH22_01380 [Candidatus Nanoarchaeia archaeon]|nr:hypothetical protein [Candidatus Nanoarchaeia archaeon]